MAANRQQIEHLQQEMLQSMRRENALATPGVEAAFADVPRHLFLPNVSLEDVYSDKSIGVKYDASGLLTSSSSQPSMMAIMLNQLELDSGQNVLEIGTATGYNAAIMKHIVGDKGTVTSIEIDNDLAKQAQDNLQRAKYGRVTVVNADGVQGYGPRAAYDRIVSTVGVWDVPPAWLSQLKPQGSVVVPIVIDGVQVSARFVPMSDGTALSVDNRPCAFVYMLGQYAGPDVRRKIGSTAMYILADQVDKIDTAALHLLISNDHEYCQFDSFVSVTDFWFGYQTYLMLHEADRYVFFVYSIVEGQKAYGMEGRGIAYFTKSSAAFVNYAEKGLVHCFAGVDAFLEMQTAMDDWQALGKPTNEQLRLRLIPKSASKPEIERGKLYERYDHYLHAWLDVEALPENS